MSKSHRIKEIMDELERKAEALNQSEHDRIQEVLESVEARCGEKARDCVSMSIELMSVLVQQSMMIVKLGAPTHISRLMLNRSQHIHSAVSAVMIALSINDDASAKREVECLRTLMDQKFDHLKRLEALAAEATAAIQTIEGE